MTNRRYLLAFWGAIVLATAALLANLAVPECREAGNPIRPIALSASSFLLAFSIGLKVVHRRHYAGVIACRPSPAPAIASNRRTVSTPG